jgi:hypothetical protein
MGGNLINYPNDCGTPTVDLLIVKLLLNSIISTPNAKIMSTNIKGFYLKTQMTCYKYFRMKLELFPKDVIKEYNLRNKVDSNGNIHCKVRQGMYGLPQVSTIAQELLKEHLLKASTHNQKSHPDTGSTNGTLSVSLYSWMILVSNTSAKNMSNISYKCSGKTTRLKKIGKEHFTLELL